MKNSDEKVNIRAFRDEKQKKKLKKAKVVFRGEWITHLYVNNNRTKSSNGIF